MENKAVRKITEVSSIKKTIDNDQAKNVKKSIAAAISDVELILGELQIKKPSNKKEMFDLSGSEDQSEEELLEEEED